MKELWAEKKKDIIVGGALVIFGVFLSYAVPLFGKLSADYWLIGTGMGLVVVLFALRYPLNAAFPKKQPPSMTAGTPNQADIAAGALRSALMSSKWEGQLIKARTGSGTVYFVRNGVAYPLRGWENVEGIGGLSKDELAHVHETEVHHLPKGPLIDSRAGMRSVYEQRTPVSLPQFPTVGDASFWERRMIQAQGENAVYFVSHGKRHLLHKWSYAKPHGFDRPDCWSIPRQYVYAIPAGEPDIITEAIMRSLL